MASKRFPKQSTEVGELNLLINTWKGLNDKFPANRIGDGEAAATWECILDKGILEKRAGSTKLVSTLQSWPDRFHYTGDDEPDDGDDRDTGTGVADPPNSTFTDSSKSWTQGEWEGSELTVNGQNYVVVSNTATMLTLAVPCASGDYVLKRWDRTAAGTWSAVATNGILVTDTNSGAGSSSTIRYLRTMQNLNNALGMTLKTRMKVDATQSAVGGYEIILLDDGTKKTDVRFYKDTIYQQKGASEERSYSVDTTDDFHVYIIILHGTHSRVYMDGTLILDGKAATASQTLCWGSLTDSAPAATAKAHWDYVKLQKWAQPPGEDAIRSIFPYRASDGSDYLMLASGEALYKTDDFSEFTNISPPANRNYPVRGLEHRGILWCATGADRPFVYDGISTTHLTGVDADYGCPVAKLITNHRGRVFLGNSIDVPWSLRYNRLTEDNGTARDPDYLDTGIPVMWPHYNEILLPNGQALTAQFSVPSPQGSHLIVGQADQIYVLFGWDINSFALRLVEGRTGIVNQESCVYFRGALVFLGRDGNDVGVYRMSGLKAQKISDPWIDATLQAARIPREHYKITTTEDAWNDCTILDGAATVADAADGRGFYLIGDGGDVTISSPILFADEVVEWGCFESITSDIGPNYRVRSAAAKSTLTDDPNWTSVTGSVIDNGQKIAETVGNRYFQFKATTTSSIKIYTIRIVFQTGGEFREWPNMHIHNDSLYLAVSDGTSSGSQLASGYGTKYNNILLRMDNRGRWTKTTGHYPLCISDFRQNMLYGAANDDGLWQFDTGTQDNGNNYDMQYETRQDDMGFPGILKELTPKGIFVTYQETAAATWTLKYKLTKGTSAGSWISKTVTPASAQIETARIPLAAGQNFDTLQFQIAHNGSATLKVHQIRVPYKVKPGILWPRLS